MALLDFIKKKKEVSTQAPQYPPQANPAYSSPVEQVMQMQQQGLTNDQVIEAMQRQGYDNATVMDAMSQASMKAGVQGYPQEEPAHQEHYAEPQASGTSKEDMEAAVEGIVAEKWKEFSKSHANTSEWQESMSTKVDKMEQNMVDLRADVENLHKAIVNKIGEYDKSLIDVGTEIKAMEKVFQKVLPTLTENVAELSRITNTQKSSAMPRKTVKK